MANLNTRQVAFINDLKQCSKDMKDLYGIAHDLSKRFVEEFCAEKDHCLSDCDNLETTYFCNCTDIGNAIDGLDAFINFWTGIAVDTEEYGKFFRRIK